MVNCDLCQDTGLEPIFEHISFPAHSPAQKQVSVEPYEFERADRQWEEDGMVHQLLEGFRLCDCPAGQKREITMKERQHSKGSNGHGWQPGRTKQTTGVRQ